MGTKMTVSTKLKVVFLSRYVGIVNRGVETYVLELSKRLKNDFDVTILSGKDSDNLSLITDSGFDVVIATNGRMQSLKASLGRLFRKYKLIIPGQAGIGRDDRWNIFVTQPDVYVALTQFEMDWAKKWAWNSKVVKISNGVDLDRFSKAGQKISLNIKGPVVLSVGALEWYKHHRRTIEAMAKLNVGSLILVGTGSEKDELEEVGNRLLGPERFQIISADYQQMPTVYRAGDLFVLPSWVHESFGIVYVEAMASGLAIVAPDDPPRREIIGYAGIFTDVENADLYSKAITEALSKKWDDLPRKQAENFSWDKIALQYKELIEGLLK
jgi:glycosyltransferase involved in cell wall biosynthesis